MANRKPAGPATKSKNYKALSSLIGAALLIAVLVGGATAQVVVNPINGHSYEYVRIRGYVTWDQAREGAAARGGYLATITDSIEARLVAGLFSGPGQKAFLGATDANDSCDWLWVTGEPFRYTNWASGEPSGEEPCENSLRTSYEHGGMWEADVGPLDGWVVEWNSPQIDTLINLRQWPASEGGNGHWYGLLPTTMNWVAANLAASQIQRYGHTGHLATVTSQAENDFIFHQILQTTIIAFPSTHWLGGYFDQHSGSWRWVNNEPFVYTNFGGIDPPPQGPFAIGMVGPSVDSGGVPGLWISSPLTAAYYSIVEFDTPVTPPLVNLMQWPVSVGGNGHWYAFSRRTMTWGEALDLAGTFTQNGVAGHLATVTSAEENDFITQLIMPEIVTTSVDSYAPAFWLGGYAADQWRWITGEPFGYSHFFGRVPFDSGNVIAMRGYSHWMDTTMGFWDSRSPQCDTFPFGCLHAVIEFDTEPQTDTLLSLMQWPVSEGGNGHWYAYLPSYLTWDQALRAAGQYTVDGVPGHLATITSSQENDFAFRAISFDPTNPIGRTGHHWLGGHDDSLWTWVTGEPMLYTNWAIGQPMYEDGNPAVAMVGPPWMECALCPQPSEWVAHAKSRTLSAIVEFDTEAVPMVIGPIEWPVADGGNGHNYSIMLSFGSWHDADYLATQQKLDGVTGHLATITTQSENQFIVDHLINVPYPAIYFFTPEWWIGAFQPARGVWSWTTGEPFEYTNWTDSLPPANTDLAAAIVAFGRDSNATNVGQWIQRDPTCSGAFGDCLISIVEFDTEPSEHRTLYVPEEFPTIQAAIDSARHGDRVLVSPGVYTESITFHGKNITVRAADGPLHTVITNDRRINLVTFKDGETLDAVLEGFTLQGGWIAVLCVNSAPTIRHNICVGQNVWNWAAICLSGDLDSNLISDDDPEYSAHLGEAPAIIVNNTIVNCTNGGISSFSVSAPTIWNNIIAFNAHYGLHHQGGFSQESPQVGYNDVYGNPDANYYNIPDPGPGSISVDPLFDTRPFAASWSLSAESPCINAGDPDPAFNDPDGTRNDMGALPYEYGGGGVIPTNEWIVIYCNPEGPDTPEGSSLIQAFDPDGVLCGEVVRYWGHSYGFMPIYRDDPYTAIDEGCEPGDQVQFKIDGVSVQSDPPVFWTANGDTFEVCGFMSQLCVDIPLHTGWNLISWNVAYEGPIRLAFDELIGCVDVVLSYEQGGLVFDPNLDLFNTLTQVDYRHGYWVRMNCDAVLQICGQFIPREAWINLEPGWNLVSYWPWDALPVEAGFVSIIDSLQQAMGFDNGAQIWLPDVWFSTLSELRPTFGYWAKVTDNLPLVYPGYQLPDTIIITLNDSGNDQPSLVETSRDWMSVYGSNLSLDGRPVADGALIEFSLGDDVVCGRGVYSNNVLKLTSVYGHDASGDAARYYPKEGDEIAVSINGARVYPNLTWSGSGARVSLGRLTTDSRGLPESFALAQNYPNPFNPETTILFDIASDGHASLTVYNVLGQKVRTLADAYFAVGRYEVAWDGTDDDGRGVSTGVYFYRLSAESTILTRKMLLLK